MRLLAQLGAVGLATAVGSAAVMAVDGRWLPTLVLGIAAAALALVVYRWVVARTEHRPVVEVAPTGAAGATARGVALGALVFTAVIATVAVLGGYRVEGPGSATTALGLVGFMTVAAVTEELLFRGVLFRVVEERAGTWGALVLTAVLFGAVHLTNPGASLWGGTAVAIEAGAMLAAAYAATRTLWLPIGIHLGWNLVASGVFGTEVSGNGTPQGLLDGATSGPVLLSGGAFGPEASLPAVLAGVALTVVFLRLAHRRGRLVPRRARRSTPGATDGATAAGAPPATVGA
ncbi:CPBP family intramembrane glutamic endopeptidase [Cellulomonas telluris]|uniref:CPBP family intramembrane glutamic endopeptidase n=1 Tax=Cellulomonas telluris TaxID=2306636 RepID=UPI0010A84F9C|nr:CPBP family intramembrane glutamic endopeptidase [Cellulomonas telluris]